ncbi:dGTPase [Gilliamella sp. wkB18]|uniref:dGTPase n=1 Tax=Gilliamella sp. wkB18 TaxID=3120260 RepID=UPI00080EB42E|nr:dGTPase [Gilliamella apicola]OCG65123.1 dGTPase [Gilliamella apicola]
MIDFNKKISYQRYTSKVCEDLTDAYSIVRQFESDRGRIINSAAIRRLQQKTQVFPLERNSVVRTRLTHSMEVQQVGRYIVKEIMYRLGKWRKLKTYGLDSAIMSIESLVEMACLMHDIGNPPFGHFGEKAINQWFIERLGIDTPSKYPLLELQESDTTELKKLKTKIRRDLSNFEGNAQAIRLIHSILRLNLTYSQVASILKYSKPAYWAKNDVPAKFSYLMKKPGYYLSEEQFIQKLSEQLEIKPFHRYPLTYIMEAADDISYCIADLEDAVEKKLFTVQQLYHYLEKAWGTIKDNDLFSRVVKRPYDNLKKNGFNAIAIGQFFMYVRVNAIGKLVPHAAERFIENIEDIYHGSFNHALLEDNGAEYQLLKIFKRVGVEHVFNHESVENIELQGYRIISGLLDIYSPLLNMSTAEFLKLAEDNVHQGYPIETRLYHKLSAKHCDAYQQAIKNIEKIEPSFACWEFYYRCRLIQDYISGMTDHFAYDEYRKLMVTF